MQSGAVHGGPDGVVIRRLRELYIHQRSAAEVDPNGMPCQNSMENKPATLKTREKARKYHFFPRKSMFALRKNSTYTEPRFLTITISGNGLRLPTLELPDAQRFAALLSAQDPVKNHA